MKTYEEGYALGWADAIYAYESRQRKQMSTVDELMTLAFHSTCGPDELRSAERAEKLGLPGRTEREQPTNTEDAAAGNVNAIRHIAYAEGYADGKKAKHEQDAEPVVVRWMWKDSDESQVWRYTEPPIWKDGSPSKLIVQKLYASPPKRAPLTEEQIHAITFSLSIDLNDESGASEALTQALVDFARLVERAHGIGDE